MSTACEHQNFSVKAEVARITDVGAYHVGIRVWCTDCGLPFVWVGLPNGFSHYQPTVSIDSQELNCPLVPLNGKVPEGLAGFRVTHISADEEPRKPQ